MHTYIVAHIKLVLHFAWLVEAVLIFQQAALRHKWSSRYSRCTGSYNVNPWNYLFSVNETLCMVAIYMLVIMIAETLMEIKKNFIIYLFLAIYTFYFL